MKKILIITYYWPPSGGAGVQRWLKFVKYMSKMDVEPYVLTIDPNNATYPQKDESLEKEIPPNVKVFTTKAFSVYRFYKKFSSNKEVPYGGSANIEKINFKEKLLRFIRGNFFLPDPRKSWNKSAYKKALQIIDEYQIDTVITTSPPHSTQLIGLKLKNNRAINWIADLRDPWTDIFYYKQFYPTFWADAIQKRYERQVLKRANRIITVSKSLKQLFLSKTDIDNAKISVITNGYDKDDFVGKQEKKNTKFTISYIGTLSNEYPLDGFVEALTGLSKEERENFTIQFVGKIDGGVINKIKENGFEKNLELIDYVKHSKAVDFMINADLLLLAIPQSINNQSIVTGKLFEYMASNTPILFIGPPNGDAADIIRETSAGAVFDKQESGKMREYLQRIMQQKSIEKKRLNQKVEKYSRENLTKNLIELF